MVVFTCNHCGESIQKPKVEKHYQFACRNSKFLTCVDCFKDFRGEEFVAHTKCVTEDERYAAKGTFQNGIVKKGEVKQENWVDMIKSILNKENNLAPNHRNLLNTISSYSNVPRKKNKFINFIKSSSGHRVNLNDIEAVWTIIEKYKNENKPNNPQSKENGQKEEKNIKNTNKRKLKEDSNVVCDAKKVKSEKNGETEREQLINENAEVFSFQQKILEIVQKKGTISVKKLEKKVVNAYIKCMGEIKDRDKVIKKINKKLKRVQGIKIDDDNVLLI